MFPQNFLPMLGAPLRQTYPIPPMQYLPRGFDNMIVPNYPGTQNPYGLPPDKNTIDPNEFSALNFINNILGLGTIGH